MKKYLVCYSENDIKDCEMVIVNAESKEEAIDKYITNIVINHSWFLESVYDTARNMSYAEALYVDEHKQYLFDEYGNPKYSYEKINEYFLNNVKELFKGKEDWYNLYMKLFNGEQVVFPREMLIHMYKNNPYNTKEELLCKNIEEDIPQLK